MLTLAIGGDLFRHGGVVVVYPIPVTAGQDSDAVGELKPLPLEARYAEVQLRYPATGRSVFRFRVAEEGPDTAAFRTQLLTIIGTDMEGRGPEMHEGFSGARSSGGQVIRVLPRDEWGGSDEVTRTHARWGMTRDQGYDAPPPADQRSARGLMALMEDSSRRVPRRCEGDARVQACIIAAEHWPRVETLWWRQIAEARLERQYYHALRRCYDAQRFRSRQCEQNPDADEPEFR